MSDPSGPGEPPSDGRGPRRSDERFPGTGRPRALPRQLLDVVLAPLRVALSFPGGRRRLLRRILIVNVMDATGLFLVAGPLPGIEVASWLSAFGVTVVAAIVTVFVRPALLFAARSLAIVAFLLTFVLNALVLQVVGGLLPGVEVTSFAGALAAAFAVAAANTIVSGMLSLDEEDSFYGHVLKQLSRQRGIVDASSTPGTVLLQVDGLAAPILRHAIRTGEMPFLARWIRSGSHRLVEWECTVPTMTSSSQAGILHGNNHGIPAFRWYEKDRGRLLVSNRPADAAEIERRVAGERDLLRPHGTSVSNLLSGGAGRVLLTTSNLHVGAGLLVSGRPANELYAWLVNPYSLFRGLVQSILLIALEWYQARRQAVRDIRPRMHRGGMFPILRAVSSVILRDITTTIVIEDMQRGVPIIYADLLNYDEIAHHAGPERSEAMRELEAIDRQIRTIVRGAEGAPRPYRFVILSDHGQSLGATFRDRYGMGLDELLRDFMQGDPSVRAAVEDVESWGHVNALLTQVIQARGIGARLARSVLRRRTRDGYVELGPSGQRRPGGTRKGSAGPAEIPELVVCASGNLALVYFNAIGERATLEEIEELQPGLVGRLAAHPGIGFVLGRSEALGPVVVGARGVHVLETGRVEGEDPLVPFGPNAAAGLRRLDTFTHVGDLVVNSFIDPATEEVAPFEKLIGCHGGLGGAQTRPFLLVPAEWPEEPGPIVGAEAVNALLLGWIAPDRVTVPPAEALPAPAVV